MRPSTNLSRKDPHVEDDTRLPEPVSERNLTFTVGSGRGRGSCGAEGGSLATGVEFHYFSRTMKVQVLYFAGLQDLVGKREETYLVEENASLKDLREKIFGQFPKMAAMGSAIRIAVNEEYAALDRPLCEGDTVALIPPVSGG